MTTRQRGRSSVARAADARATGVALRHTVPRSLHAMPVRYERDAVAILEQQNESRVAGLVPLRMARMAADSFAFFRGTAALMAADLATDVNTGIEIVSCGDAHVSNFGFFASPQRSLVFDLNDFDEASLAPWEWDVKRLVTSAIVGARASAMDEAEARGAGLVAASAYRKRLRLLSGLPAVERYYHRLDADTMRAALGAEDRPTLDSITKKARRRTSEQYVEKMTVVDADGERVFVDDPPILSHIPAAERLDVDGIIGQYLDSLPPDVALLLSHYDVTDVAMRVVGVGSVGTRCFVVLLTGAHGESLVLQVKEAQKSVLTAWGGRKTTTTHEGRRVVANQRILQAVSDVFLGDVHFNDRDFYVRQYRDMKGSVELASLSPGQYSAYLTACGRSLARAHSQSTAAGTIAGYLGSADTFDHAVVDWSIQYADRSLADFEAFTAAIASGRVAIA